MKVILIVFLFLMFSSCSHSKYSNEENNLQTLLGHYGIDGTLSNSTYVVTYSSGCDACLKKTRDFIIKEIDNRDIFFIVCAESKKQLKIDFPYEIRTQENFLIDSSMLALSLIGTYPKAIFCDAGNVVDVKEINFENADKIFKEIEEHSLKNGLSER